MGVFGHLLLKTKEHFTAECPSWRQPSLPDIGVFLPWHHHLYNEFNVSRSTPGRVKCFLVLSPGWVDSFQIKTADRIECSVVVTPIWVQCFLFVSSGRNRSNSSSRVDWVVSGSNFSLPSIHSLSMQINKTIVIFTTGK